MKKIFVVGLLVKLFFIFAAYHHDLLFIWKEQFNLSAEQKAAGENYYPPLAYISFYLLSPLYWMSIKAGYWILKLPYLVFDLGILKILFNLFAKHNRAQIMKLWWLNPVVIYAAYAQGQYEIIPAFLIILSVYLIGDGAGKSIAALAAAGAYKTLPVFSLPPAILYLSKNWTRGLRLSLISLSILIIPGLILGELIGFDVFQSYFPRVATPGLECSLRPDALVNCAFAAVGLAGYLLLLWLIIGQRRKVGYGEIIYISLAMVFVVNPANLLHRFVLIIPLMVYIFVKKNWDAKWLWGFSLILFLGYVYTWPLEWGLVDHIWPQVNSFPALREWFAQWGNYENIALVSRIFAKLILLWAAVKSFQSFGSGRG